LLHKADKIFVISKELKKYLIKKHFDPSKLIVTGNGIEINLIKKSKKEKKYNFDALFIGRINESKGIFDMLDVVIKIKQVYPKFKLAIMGNGNKKVKNKLNIKIKKLNLKNNIILLGTVTGLKKFSIIKSSKIFIFLSKNESFGIALLEAVSSGLPAFVYNLPTYKNIYKNNEINIFKKGDIDSISNAILNTFENKKFENKNGKKLLNKYNWEKIANIEYKSFISLVDSKDYLLL
jgi:glycosyltransferase involved in cell wall biosynthesis